jgi:hypothetical protein
MVEAVARRTQVDWDEDEYTQMHESLLAALRQASSGPSDPCAGLYARLETCAEPWVSLRPLRNLEPAVLLGLCDTCRRLQDELTPPRRASLGVWLVFAAVLVGAALAAFCYFRGGKLPDVRRYLELSPHPRTTTGAAERKPTGAARQLSLTSRCWGGGMVEVPRHVHMTR